MELTVSEDLQRSILDHAEVEATSRNEIIRRAMALYALARSVSEAGGQVILRPANEQEKEKIVVGF
jgi:hypothetical protein